MPDGRSPMRHILHVDDDENDRLLVRLAFKKAGIPLLIETARDGLDAIQRLERVGRYKDDGSSPLPDAVLLDVKMAGMDGFDVLTFLRSNERFPRIPVYMLTSSGQPKDSERALALGASRYFVKSADFEDVVSAVAGLLGVQTAT